MELMEATVRERATGINLKTRPYPRNDLREIFGAGVAAPWLQYADNPVYRSGRSGPCQAACGNLRKEWALTAPAAILVLTKETMSPSGVSYHIHDYSAAMENLLLAITAKGYASVWVEGQIRGERAREMGRLLEYRRNHSSGVSASRGSGKAHGGSSEKTFEERAWLNGYQKES